MKTVMCFGTFDILHPGHLFYLKEAKKHGDHLIVVVARDATKKQQNKAILFSEKERLAIVHSLQIVDEAVLGNFRDHLKIIVEKKPDVVCLGHDHAISEDDLRQRLVQLGLFPTIKRLRTYNPEKNNSSRLRKVLVGNYFYPI